MFENIAADIVGVLLTLTGVFDAYKYHWESCSIRRAKTAKGHSRKFINAAVVNDIVRIGYLLCFKQDVFLIASSLIAIVCMLEMWWVIYWYYPYRGYRKRRFKRPNLVTYTINSILPNSIRKRL